MIGLDGLVWMMGLAGLEPASSRLEGERLDSH
jgi:hypothetical protein